MLHSPRWPLATNLISPSSLPLRQRVSYSTTVASTTTTILFRWRSLENRLSFSFRLAIKLRRYPLVGNADTLTDHFTESRCSTATRLPLYPLAATVTKNLLSNLELLSKTNFGAQIEARIQTHPHRKSVDSTLENVQDFLI